MDIKVSELKQRLNKGENLNFFDVREPWEYSEFNIGAQLMPLTSIPDQLIKLNAIKNQEIIVHCKSGNRSNQAKIFLESKGFTKVRSLLGGIDAFLG
jgi:rhodanese-related sulfurtransferase|tara:strand:- start:150 stop:440 length:291 start_codon:yes stop_codon:yes gene_type:complete